MFNLQHHVELAPFTSWRVGGAADRVFFPSTRQDLSGFLQTLPANETLFWLGLGSNLLIRDGGIRGTVIITQNGLRDLRLLEGRRVFCEAGVSCAKVARFAARENLSGIEFLAGVPGTIGGALAMNAGCFDGETWDWVESVETISRNGEIRTRPKTDFKIAYRHVERGDEWFLSATFKLNSGDKASSLDKIRTLLDRRAQTQPTNFPSGGSTFRNPPNDYAARLIEQCGLKGLRIGGAVVSEKHANFLLNDQNASAADLEQLIEKVAAEVYAQTQIRLIREVHIVGEAARGSA